MTDRRMDDITLKVILETDTDTVTSRYLKLWQLDTEWWMGQVADMANIKPPQFSLCQSLIHQPWHLFFAGTVTSSVTVYWCQCFSFTLCCIKWTWRSRGSAPKANLWFGVLGFRQIRNRSVSPDSQTGGVVNPQHPSLACRLTVVTAIWKLWRWKSHPAVRYSLTSWHVPINACASHPYMSM